MTGCGQWNGNGGGMCYSGWKLKSQCVADHSLLPRQLATSRWWPPISPGPNVRIQWAALPGAHRDTYPGLEALRVGSCLLLHNNWPILTPLLPLCGRKRSQTCSAPHLRSHSYKRVKSLILNPASLLQYTTDLLRVGSGGSQTHPATYLWPHSNVCCVCALLSRFSHVRLFAT